jgi:class 3 adenylate cyclase
MAFYDLVDRVVALLQQRGRMSYRALARQFELDTAQLDDLKFELIEVQRVAVDQDAAILVWTGPPDAPAVTGAREGVPDPSAVRVEGEPPIQEASSTTSPHEQGAERRQLSMMFCDLVGSTALAEALDRKSCGRCCMTTRPCAPG